MAILRLLRGGVTWWWDSAQYLQGLLCIGVIGINLQCHLELAFPCLDVAFASKDEPQVPMQDRELLHCPQVFMDSCSCSTAWGQS